MDQRESAPPSYVSDMKKDMADSLGKLFVQCKATYMGAFQEEQDGVDEELGPLERDDDKTFTEIFFDRLSSTIHKLYKEGIE